MQKRLKLIAGLLCLPLLFGCDGRDITTNDGDKFHPMMNLETMGPFRYDSYHFSGFGKKATAEEIVKRVDYGEDVLFAFTKDDCSSCESFLKNAGKYIYFSNYRLSYIDEDHKAAAEKINKDGSLPPGVKVVPYYDRSTLVDVTTHTVMHNLVFGCLLVFLVQHAGYTFTREALLQHVWGFDYYGGPRTVDVHVRRIRSKLGPNLAQYLETVRGVGYLWNLV